MRLLLRKGATGFLVWGYGEKKVKTLEVKAGAPSPSSSGLSPSGVVPVSAASPDGAKSVTSRANVRSVGKKKSGVALKWSKGVSNEVLMQPVYASSTDHSEEEETGEASRDSTESDDSHNETSVATLAGSSAKQTVGGEPTSPGLSTWGRRFVAVGLLMVEVLQRRCVFCCKTTLVLGCMPVFMGLGRWKFSTCFALRFLLHAHAAVSGCHWN
ncbi:hypothetical protein K2173_026818 [Erythroxylum novogranatense]|uniref:Uncharacterized protein n=1 Tax=Erythroxylum novogranatense TaxID=1862640 RepID=A0AAV8TXA1_9ROSI|nr:hypothetical protein K2173_026818 [Erythroxylum novogranatense]